MKTKQAETDLEAQTHVISNHDVGNDPEHDAETMNQGNEWDDAAPDVNFSVSTPDRHLVRQISSAESSADETSLSA